MTKGQLAAVYLIGGAIVAAATALVLGLGFGDCMTQAAC